MTTELIEKLEAATEGTGALNVLVWRAVDPEAVAKCERDLRLAGYEPSDDLLANNCEDFTGSLDAALTLVPEGWFVYGMGERVKAITYRGDSHENDGGYWAEVQYRPSGGLLQKAIGATLPLALCIAALKALSRGKD